MFIKHTVFMTLSTMVRLLSAVVLFIIMARVLGPADFGRFMYSFTLASIAVLIIEYGFVIQLLRDIGRNPNKVNSIMADAFTAKLLLTTGVILVSAILSVIFLSGYQEILLFWLLFGSCTLNSFGDFWNIAFRGVGKFSEETKVATSGSIFHFLAIVIILFYSSGLIEIAFGFFISRLFYCLLSWRAFSRIFGKVNLLGSSVSNSFAKLKECLPYAIDTGVSNFFNQIDTMLVKHFTGPAGVGIYQAGMRFVNGAMQFAPVLGNVYIPKISAINPSDQQFSSIAKRMNLIMIALGLMVWLGFAFLGKYITSFILGNEFSELNALWPWLGMLVFVRYLTASQGVLLTSSGSQRIRIIAQVAALINLLVCAPFFLQSFGVIGIVFALIVTLLLLFAIYFGALLSKKIPTGMGIANFLLVILCFVGFFVLDFPYA